ncbi:hypothetical protein [Sphingosinicella rhizophila]|uniref:Uncharacterized protein n=1 Tax=Sphingosinicella rhizophila TaxID=3050082 RepID=A0ABU3Q8V0_9SPHN|nr:hypothetical protein [Sphingosinicella sp. GR2756]MDT9599829.1 hypothetical protein [Sphingosinicella sp. GR2756]
MTQAGLWWGAGVSMAIALLAGLAEWRRGKRRDLDRVGIMPWNAIQIFALLIAVIAAALALKG